MLRRCCLFTMLLTTLMLAGKMSCAAGKHKETIDPAEAQQDPDFAIQGEYLGQHVLFDGAQGDVGAQVIALGDGKFNAVILKGGLPGAGWKLGDPRLQLEGQRQANAVAFKDPAGSSQLSATIADGKLTLSDGKSNATLQRAQRRSPTLGAKPPAGALVLFDGTVNRFPGSTVTADGNLMSEATSILLPASYTMHVEFRLSYMSTARGQARSNSGVYLHNCYEVQVLDSFGLEGLDNECGGIYKMARPEVNMCLPPLVWQTYDIEFTAPIYDAGGNKTADARLTVRHNGVTIQQRLALSSGTPGRQPEGPPPRPVYLQGHGNHVEYRNIWLVEEK